MSDNTTTPNVVHAWTAEIEGPQVFNEPPPLFDPKNLGPTESSVYEVEKTTERFISLMRQSPLLASGCESG